MERPPTIDIKKLRFTPKPIIIRGFVDSKSRGNLPIKNFVVRQKTSTLICSILEDNTQAQKVFEELNNETHVSMLGKTVKEESNKTTVKDVKFIVHKMWINGQSTKNLPFLLKDVNTPLGENPLVKYEKCLNNRALYLRSIPGLAIAKMISDACYIFRKALREKGFFEITTPKLISGASEGGANVFEVKFFKKQAFLAQSPQLYKQMAIVGGFKKVFEIGHVYRQEESNINKYLSEFTGLDFEMEIEENYYECINLVHEVITSMIYYMKKSPFYNDIQKYRPFEDIRYRRKPVILTHKACVDILRENGFEDLPYITDFSRQQEKKLGEHVAERYKVDLFCIKDYPTEIRAFYSKAREESPYSYSYDFLLRGEEICSGAERINSSEVLEKTLEERGIDKTHLKSYIESFSYGAPRHGGVGIGLERFLKSLFNFDDIRYFSLFPRDPKRLTP